MPHKKPHHRRIDARTGRNKGDAQHVRIYHSMAHHAAFRSLSGSAVKVWIELRTAYNGGNNGQLSLSYQRGADLLGLSKSSVARAFKELEKKGFIKKKKQGQWYGRLASEWICTDKGTEGYPATQDWERWRDVRPKKPVAVPRRRQPHGYGDLGPNFEEPLSAAEVLVRRHAG